MECPYCEEFFDYSDDEPGAEDFIEQAQCPKCDKNFTFHRSYSISYYTHTADCLNGVPHKFKQSIRTPAVIAGQTKWRCNCGTEEYRPAKCQHTGPFCLECQE